MLSCVHSVVHADMLVISILHFIILIHSRRLRFHIFLLILSLHFS